MLAYDFTDQVRPRGHLEIDKVYRDGTVENVLDDHNVITSGMSVNLSILFSLSGSQDITDFLFDRWQLGVSGHVSNMVSSTYELSGPLVTTEEYTGQGADLICVSSTQIKNGSFVPNQVMAIIPYKAKTRLNKTTVRHTLVLDYEAGNDITRDGIAVPLNEIGLLAKNPGGYTPHASILCAYRVFSPIIKTSEFSLVFRWLIEW